MIEVTINHDILEAMRSKDKVKLNTLRALKAAIGNYKIANGGNDLEDKEIINLIRKQISQRNDTISQAGDSRPDLVANEKAEIAVLEAYLPEELSDDELWNIISTVLQEFDSPTKKDMGKIISKTIPIVNGRADNKRVSQMIGSKL